MIRLNLGCGTQIPDDWINVDYALGAKLAKVPVFSLLNRYLRLLHTEWDSRIYLHDLRRPLPWEDAAAESVYTSHTLEHLTKEEGQRLLSECYRVLVPGGILRVVVPDLRHVVLRYMNGHTSAEDFLEDLGVLYSVPRSRLRRAVTPYVEFPHKCMYDQEALLRALKRSGFDCKIRAPFESGIEDIASIEVAERTRCAVIVEGVKP